MRVARVDVLMTGDTDTPEVARVDTDDVAVLICLSEGAFDADTVNVDKAKLNVGAALLEIVEVADALALETSDALLLTDRDDDTVGRGEVVPSFTLAVPVIDTVTIAVLVAESLPELKEVADMVFTFVANAVSVPRATLGDTDILDVSEESAETLEIELAEVVNEEYADTVMPEALAV